METGTSPHPDPGPIMQVGLGFWASKTLLSAIELGLFTQLAAGSMDLAAISARLGLHARSARDFLDALVALGFLDRHNGAYSNTAATDFFLDRKKPSYIGGILEMANQRLYGFWGNLTAGLRSGEPQNEVQTGAKDPFTDLYADPQRLKNFLQAMTSISNPSNRLIARTFPWSQHKVAADLGTAQGDLITQVALANLHLRGIGFDLAQVEPHFIQYVAQQGLSARVKFHPGSFFDDPLPAADVYMFGHILHDWNLEQKRQLIAKCHAALPPGGALLVYDSIIDDDRRHNAFGLLMSLNMLIETPGGFDYTGADCMGWMRDAGFANTRVVPLAGPDSMVIGVK